MTQELVNRLLEAGVLVAPLGKASGDERWKIAEACREAAAALSEAQKALRVVQNAAKTIASAHGTELEHLRQNKTYDHKLRAEHESLLDRDAQMTDALLAAEAHADSLAAELAQCREALKPFGSYFDQARFDLDNNGNPLPDEQGIGWAYITVGDLRRARTALKGASHERA